MNEIKALIKEIEDSLKERQNGVTYSYWDHMKKQYVESKHQPERGKGTKAYTMRRIQMVEDKLKELKKDLEKGKYDFRG